MVPVTEIYCFIDDFCKYFEHEEAKKSLFDKNSRNRECSMSLSEMMTIVILFHMSGYKTFKDFYINHILFQLKKEFPKPLSYNRFIQLMHRLFTPMIVLIYQLQGKHTGKYYVDSTKVPVCHNLRIKSHKVFKDSAARGKTSTGWFFGFKLHLIINDQGEIMSFTLTSGNVDDRAVLESLTQRLQGWLFGDRGYIGKKITDTLAQKGVELITKTKANMKQKILDPVKDYFLNKRGVIESVIDQLKNIMTIDHSRHRSPINMQINLLAGLVAYIFKPKKPSVAFNRHIENLSPKQKV